LTLNVLFTFETTQCSWPLFQIAALVVAPRQPGPDRARFYWKRCINDLLLFAETRFCDSSQMKSMADFGPTREGDQLRARDPRRKKIILESKKHKVEFVHFWHRGRSRLHFGLCVQSPEGKG
jgi:hypothetical protein